MQKGILIVDFGSQYTQLIARKIREQHVYCEIHPYHNLPETYGDLNGIILSGSPFSVEATEAPTFDFSSFVGKYPILGVCFGAQLLAKHFGGKVEKSNKREYGKATVQIESQHAFFRSCKPSSQVWMSHADTVIELPPMAEKLAKTETIPFASFELKGFEKKVIGIQFHPEVYHSEEGEKMLSNFVLDICKCPADWTPDSFISSKVQQLKEQIGTDTVILGLSGGVDSSVAAGLLHQAVGSQLHCIFIDNGLLRKNEFEEVLASYKNLGLNVQGIDANERFLNALKGEKDPERKRKIIGRVFIEVFEEEALQIRGAKWLAQGTIYPDVIESVSVHGPSAKIKSHHNVGGLPEKMSLKVVEPLRELFKDEVRKTGLTLGLPKEIIGRHPFPGPGLAVRILGDITANKVSLLQEADYIFINGLKKWKLYNDVWQAGVILLPIQSVGVMGDERTYEQVVSLRAVHSTDGMTAEWVRLPYDFMAEISNQIINQVKGINRVVYDISTKPPATIEWE